MEPVRSLRRDISFHLAHCTSVDVARRVVVAEVDALAAGMPAGGPPETFELKYDHLVLACGAVSNTFNIPGVREHANFLKEIQDARAIRRRIIDCTPHPGKGGGGRGARSQHAGPIPPDPPPSLRPAAAAVRQTCPHHVLQALSVRWSRA